MIIFSDEERRRLEQRFNAKHHNDRGSRYFEIVAEEREGKTWLQTLLRNDNNSFHYPVEAYISNSAQKPARAQAFFLLAYLDSYWEEFFADDDENVYLPIDWTVYRYQEQDFYLRGQIINLMVEKMADKLLNVSSSTPTPV